MNSLVLPPVPQQSPLKVSPPPPEYLMDLILNGQSVFIFTGPDRRIRWVNRAFTLLTGFELDEVLGKKPSILQGPETDPETVRRMRAALNAQRGYREMVVNYSRTGQPYWCLLEVVPCRDADGNLLGYLSQQTDITALKNREKELTAATQRFQMCMNGSSDGYWDWDLRVDDLYLSPSLKAQLGYGPDELPSNTLAFFTRLHPDDQSALNAAIQDVLQNRTDRYQVEFRLRHRDGTYRWILSRAVAVREPDGTAARLAGSHTDISDRKEKEAQLIEANRQLEEAMSQAQEMAMRAEMASRAKSEFLARISQKVRGPMNGVLGMASLLLDAGLNPLQKRYAEMVRSSAEELLALLNDIRDLCLIESGKIRIEETPFDLLALLEDLHQQFALTASEKELDFRFEAAPGTPRHLIGDPARLRQVLLNLLSNALRFTPQGRVGLRVCRFFSEPERIALEFCVSDTGLGIAKDKIPQLLDKNAALGLCGEEEGSSSSLGLAISKELVQLMGGTLRIQSDEGQGTDVRFTAVFQPHPEATGDLPRVIQSTPPIPETALTAPQSPLTGFRVLVVEDDPTNCQVALGLLKKHGVEAAAAHDGQKALRLLATEPFHLVMMDLEMPVLDGFEAARAIRRGNSGILNPQVPIIALTAHAQEDVLQDCLDAGMNGQLGKPLRPAELRQTLEKWLLPHTPAAATTTTSQPPAPSPLVWDEAGLHQRLLGDTGLARSVVRIFIEEAPRLLNELESALASADPTHASALAHTLKGAARNVGADALAETARVLEDNLKNSTPHGNDGTALLEPVRQKLSQFLEYVAPLLSPQNSEGS